MMKKSSRKLKALPVNEVRTSHKEGNLLGPSFLLLVFAGQHTSHNSVDMLLVRRITTLMNKITKFLAEVSNIQKCHHWHTRIY
jgi:hypothetical protein